MSRRHDGYPGYRSGVVTDDGFGPKKADAVRQSADHVTYDQFKAGLAETRTEFAAVAVRLYRFLMVQALRIIGATVAILRFFD